MKQVSLSDGEWKLMNALWDASPRTITELGAALKHETGWSKHTIISMLARLELKGAVAYRHDGRAKRFYPCINRENAQTTETRSFLRRLYGGSLGLMVNTMVRKKGLSKEEIDELYEILRMAREDCHD